MDEYNNGIIEELQENGEVATPSVVSNHISDTPQSNQAAETPPAPEAVHTPAEGQTLEAPKTTKAPKTKKSVSAIISTIFITVVIATGLVALAISVGSYVSDVRGYTAALDTLMDVVSNAESDDLGKLFPNQEVQNVVEEELGEKQEHIEYMTDNAVEQDITNDKIKTFEYEIISVESVNEDKRNDIGKDLEENYGMSPDCIEKAYKIKFEFSFEEDRQWYYGNRRVYAIRIDGSWYIVNTAGEFADFCD